MYQALYRKYRPRSFSDVTGQKHITETLRGQMISGKLSHAYLFVGTRGTGKTTCAKILSRAVNCLNITDGEPCGECASCVGIESGAILDVLEIDAASNNGVENVRALREEAIYSPAAVAKRVYIIDEVHMLTGAAFNALLKILEEPPQHLVFILATTELHKVPATILSRCQRFSFKRLSPASIAERLGFVAEKEGLNLTEDAAERLAVLADGSMRDALSLLDQCASDTSVDLQRVVETIGLAGRHELLLLAKTVAEVSIEAALASLDKLYCDGRDIISLLGDLSLLFRDALVYSISPSSPLLRGGFSNFELSELSSKMHPQRLLGCLETIRETMYAVSRGGSIRLTAEVCIIKLCAESISQYTVHDPQPVMQNEIDDIQVTEKFADADVQSLADTSPDYGAESSGDVTTTVSTVPSDGFWQDILDLLKNDVPIHTVLNDKTQVQAELQDGILIIHAGSPFTVNTIESDMFSQSLKKAACKALGREVAVRVGISAAAEKARIGKLEGLKTFDIVSFE